jgi:hypothetical protein
VVAVETKFEKFLNKLSNIVLLSPCYEIVEVLYPESVRLRMLFAKREIKKWEYIFRMNDYLPLFGGPRMSDTTMDPSPEVDQTKTLNDLWLESACAESEVDPLN